MEDKSTLIKHLIEIGESYTKTNYDLFKLKAISKSADAVSTLYFKLIFYIVMVLMMILINIGLSLWIGELVGKLYFGFFIVAAFYVIVALILNYIPSLIKAPMQDSLITKMLNKTKDEKELS